MDEKIQENPRPPNDTQILWEMNVTFCTSWKWIVSGPNLAQCDEVQGLKTTLWNGYGDSDSNHLLWNEPCIWLQASMNILCHNIPTDMPQTQPYKGPNFIAPLSTSCFAQRTSSSFTETVNSKYSKEQARLRGRISSKWWRNNRNIHAHACISASWPWNTA